MQIEELNNFVALFDIYGKLLSNKQFQLMEEFLNFNLSETELAESTNSSRQAVHDAITKAKKQLLEFEEKCKVFEDRKKLVKKLNDLKTNLKSESEKQIINDILENI